MTLDELKNDLDKTLADFRKTNDAALAEAKEHGKTSASTAEKVDKLNGRLDEIKDSVTKLSGNMSDRLAALALNGGGSALTRGNLAAERAKSLKAFNSQSTRGHMSADQFDAYSAAFLQYIRQSGHPSSEIHNTMSVGHDSKGGFWVPPEITGPMQRRLFDTSPMRQVCNVVTISSDALEGVIDNDEAGSGWVAEKQARPTTKTPDVGRYRIDVHEQYANPKVTQQLLDDAVVDVEAWLADKIADKLSRTENTAFVVGNGSGKPRGFLDYTKAATDDKTRAWDQIQYVATGKANNFADPTATVSPADAIIDLIYALKPQYRNNASFVGNRSSLAAIRKLKDGQGNYLYGMKLTDGAFVETILNFPVVEAEDMPAIGANAYPLAFGDFKAAYIIVDRQGVRTLVDPYTDKPFVQFYTTKRTGGGLVNGEAIKVLKVAVS